MVRTDCVYLALCLLCVVSPQVLCGKISFPGSDVEETKISERARQIRDSTRGTALSETEVLNVPENSDGLSPESRGLWESDLFFLQKLTGLFSGSEERTKPPAARQGGLRPEPLPPQIAFNKNRRQGIHINRQVPGRKPSRTKPQNEPYFQPPFQRPRPQEPSRPKDTLGLSTNNNLIAVRLPPPPPPPPSPTVNVPPVHPANKFPYEYIRTSGAPHQSPSNHLRPPAVAAPPRIDTPPQNVDIKPFPGKSVKTKKPSVFGQADLTGAFSNTPRPQVSPPLKPALQQVPLQQQPQNRLPVHKSPQLFSKPNPLEATRRPHPRPAPKPQKQHPRPPPQPQRIDVHPVKPTDTQKKPNLLEFNPSPQEGSMLADAFQPVFVASPNMDDLGNDIMKPMHILSGRSLPTTTVKPPPIFRDFFADY
ncbi:uncharacterized protein [Palaemon carinicauda]|uniref:uncharacterized protein n=1 Tax=Palaemon carinicauda TaxID=392227 RepID=UPI0035B5C5BF